MKTFREKKFRSLSRSLVIRVLLVSSLFTTLTTVVAFWMDYHTEIELIETNLSELKTVMIPGLSQAVWDENRQQLHSMVQGIAGSPDIIQVLVKNDQDSVLEEWKENKPSKYDYVEIHTFTLKMLSANKEYVTGTLTLSLTLDHMYQRLLNKAIYFFLSQGLKTLIVSFILFWIFNYYVIRHLSLLSHLAKKTDVKQLTSTGLKDFSPDTSKSTYHELDILAESFQMMCEALAKHNRVREETLKSRNRELRMQESISEKATKKASLGEMAGDIAHEINNPLAVIALQNDVFLRNIETGSYSMPVDRQKKGFYKIKAMIKRIHEVVDSMVFLTEPSKINSKDEVTLEFLSHYIASQHEEVLKSDGIELSVNFLGINPGYTLACYRTQLCQVLDSLISNATEAVFETKDPWIRVEFICQGDFLQICVLDSGPGVPKSYRSKIFAPFFPTKGIGDGSGLGLSIARNIIKDHGWKLYYDDSARYSAFCIETQEDACQKKRA